MRRALITLLAWLGICCTAAQAQSTVQLLDAGAAPREPIRYRLEAGRSERATMDIGMRIALEMGGQQIPMLAAPPIRMSMTMRATEVAADGTARIEFELGAAEVVGDQAQAAQLGAALAGIKGMSGSFSMDTQGRITGGKITSTGAAGQAADGMAANIEQTMQQLAAPFPAEAVGNGARWQVLQVADTGAIKIRQAVEYTLRSRTGNRIILDMKIADSSMDFGGAMPPGAKVDSMKMEGAGSTTMNLARLVPTASMKAGAAMSMTIEAQGQSQSMQMNLQMQQAMAPAAD
jgi:hypothetical protein